MSKRSRLKVFTSSATNFNESYESYFGTTRWRVFNLCIAMAKLEIIFHDEMKDEMLSEIKRYSNEFDKKKFNNSRQQS